MNKLILKNCIPAVIALTLTGLYSVIDGLFIGNVQGNNGLAAINIAWPIPALITAAGVGLGTGGSVLYASLCGQQKRREAQKVLPMLLMLTALTSLFLTVLLWKIQLPLLQFLGAQGEILRQAYAYTQVIIPGSLFQILGAGIIPLLRSVGCPVQAMTVTVTGMLVNLAANSVFLFRCGMGIRGTACGTVLAQAVVCCLGGYLLYRRHQMQHTIPNTEQSYRRPGEYREEKQNHPEAVCRKHRIRKQLTGMAGRILLLGISSFGVSLSATIVLIFTNWQCLRQGGSMAVAVYAVISYIVFPVQYILQGVGEGMLPVLSYAYGAGQYDRFRQYRRESGYCLLLLSTGLCVAVEWLTPFLGSGFGLSAESIPVFCRGMRISALAFLLIGFVKFHISCENAMQHVAAALFLTYVESLVAAPLLLWSLPIWFKLDGIWWSLFGTAAVMLLLYRGIQIIKKKNNCESTVQLSRKK